MHLFKIITPSERTEDKLEVTRWIVKTDLKEQTWQDLVQRLQRLFHTRSSQFFVSWFDGTDYCTIRDWQDLQEAADFFAEAKTNTDGSIRLYASPDKRDHPTVFGERPSQDDELATETDQSELETIPDDLSTTTGHTSPADVAALAEEVAAVLGPASEESEVDSEFEHVPVDKQQSPPPPQEPPLANVPVGPMGPMMLPVGYPGYPYLQQPYYGPGVSQPMVPMMVPQWQMSMEQTMVPLPQPTTPIAYPTVVPSSVVPNEEAQTSSPSPAPVPATEAEPAESEQPSILATEQSNEAPDLVGPNPPHVITSTMELVTRKKHPSHAKGEKGSSKKQYVQVAMDKLREMGYEHDEKKMKTLIKAHKGNLNEIIEQLDSW